MPINHRKAQMFAHRFAFDAFVCPVMLESQRVPGLCALKFNRRNVFEEFRHSGNVRLRSTGPRRLAKPKENRHYRIVHSAARSLPIECKRRSCSTSNQRTAAVLKTSSASSTPGGYDFKFTMLWGTLRLV